MPRQQTLEASIAWSHDLLAETERVLLRRLSVFAGGWDLEAAEAICADESLDAMAVLDGLERLIDQSLVRVEENGATARYQLLETVRQFADRVLTDPVERASIVGAHTAWYQRLAMEVGPLVEGPDDLDAIARLIPDRDNISAALRRLQVAATADDFAQTVLALCPFWYRVDKELDAGATWMTSALLRLGDEPGIAGAKLLTARAWTHLGLGRIGPLITDFSAALALCEQVDDRRTLGRIRTLGGFLNGNMDLSVGVAMLDQAYLDCEAADDPFGAANARGYTAFLYLSIGDHIQAETALREVERLLGQHGNAGLFALHRSLQAVLCVAAGDHTGAAALFTPDGRAENPMFEAGRMRFELLCAADFGEPVPSVDRLFERLRHFERTNDERTAGMVRRTIVRTRWFNDELDEALAFADVAIAGAFGGDLLLAGSLFESAQIAVALGDFEGARERFARAGDIASIQLQTTVEARTTAALLARHDGDLARAEDEVNRALSIAVEQTYIREILRALEMLAGLAAAHGSWLDAARVAGASQRQRDERRLHSRVEPFRSQLEADLAAARAALGDDGFEAAFTEGRGLALDDVVAYVRRARGERGRPTLGWASLTPTERRVVDLARVGRTNAEIAGELLMGAETVKTHLSRVYAKLGVANRTMLAALNVPLSAD